MKQLKMVRVDLLPESSTFTNVIPVSLVASRIKFTIGIDVWRNVEDIRIIIEGFLYTISCDSEFYAVSRAKHRLP